MMPAMIFASVDLPEPFGPVMATNLSLMVRLTSRMISVVLPTARQRAVDLAVDVFLGAKADLGEVCAGLGNRDILACCDRDQVLDRDSLEADRLLECIADAKIGTL